MKSVEIIEKKVKRCKKLDFVDKESNSKADQVPK